MFSSQPETEIADFLKILGSPFRIQILYTIGYGEACVCHLEAVLNKRQAYISQHLMVMRDANILETRREGKFIYYRVSDPNLFKMLKSAAVLLNIPMNDQPNISETPTLTQCDCPNCQTETITIN